MNTNISTGARRTAIFTLAALVLAAALPQVGFAQTTLNTGVWKLNRAKSSLSLSEGSQNLLSTEEKVTPAANGKPAESKLVVISNGKAYLATGAAAEDALSGKQVSPNRMVLIGTNVRSMEPCGSRCKEGRPDRRVTLTFRGINAIGEEMAKALARGEQKVARGAQ